MADKEATTPAVEDKRPLWDKVYEGCEKTLKLARKPFETAKFKRALLQARDSAELQRLDAIDAQNKHREKIGSYDPNAALSYRATVKAAERAIKGVQEEWLAFFGKEMPKLSSDDEE